jgi:hypothetical protein
MENKHPVKHDGSQAIHAQAEILDGVNSQTVMTTLSKAGLPLDILEGDHEVGCQELLQPGNWNHNDPEESRPVDNGGTSEELAIKHIRGMFDEQLILSVGNQSTAFRSLHADGLSQEANQNFILNEHSISHT